MKLYITLLSFNLAVYLSAVCLFCPLLSPSDKKKIIYEDFIKKPKKAARMIKEKSLNCSDTEDYYINLNNFLFASPLEWKNNIWMLLSLS